MLLLFVVTIVVVDVSVVIAFVVAVVVDVVVVGVVVFGGVVFNVVHVYYSNCYHCPGEYNVNVILPHVCARNWIQNLTIIETET